MTTNKELGVLTRVDLREGWQNEASDFTPWLAETENLRRLGETLQIDLELEKREKSVGPYSADLFCRNVRDGSSVVIENQLEKTDHTHLGQLLTYTAGLDAVTIIWIASKFTEEHRAALDWLNEKTPEGIAFFGLEVELWRIGDSPLAPKFNIVCRPNEWTRQIIQTRESSFDRQFAIDYWTGVFEALRPSGILDPNAKPYARHNTVFDVGWKDFFLNAHFSRPNQNGSVWVACRGPEGFRNFSVLLNNKDKIEEACGDELNWRPMEERNMGEFSIDLESLNQDNLEDWPNQHQRYADALTTLYGVINPYVQDMKT